MAAYEAIGIEGEELDIALFDQVCRISNEVGGDEARKAAEKFKARADAYIYVDKILETEGMSVNGRFIAIQVLKDMIQFKWNVIDEETKEGYRQFIFNTIINWSSFEPSTELLTLLTQMDIALVLILLQEWPRNMENIVSELIASAPNSLMFCRNNLQIIKILCEDSDINENEQITYLRSIEISNRLQEESEKIYNFVEGILVGNTFNDHEVIILALQTLKYFIKWIPPEILLQTQVFSVLCVEYLSNGNFVTPVLNLLFEIFHAPNEIKQEIQAEIPRIYQIMINGITTVLGVDFDILSFDLNLVKALASTLTLFLEKYSDKIEIAELESQISFSLNIIYNLTYHDDEEVLKICAEFWLSVARRARKEYQQNSAFVQLYSGSLPLVRRALIERMPRPVEVTVYQENGAIKREQQRATLSLHLFAVMKEALVYLTNVDRDDTIAAIDEKIALLNEEWNSTVYNSVCYSVGAITRTFPVDIEKVFLTKILKILLEMCHRMTITGERAIIAAGIMYVCSQYPRYLSKYSQFLRTIIEKLFDFMHQKDVAEVQEMAVESFRTIAVACKKNFNSGDQPFVVDIITNLDNIVSDLVSYDLIVSIFDTLSSVISFNTNKIGKTEQMLYLMEKINQRWSTATASFNPNDTDLAQELTFLLQCNAVVANNMGSYFLSQIELIFTQMMEIYTRYSNVLNDYISNSPNPIYVTRNQDFIIYKRVKSSIIEVLTNFINKANLPGQISKLIPLIIETIVLEYKTSQPETRVSDVLDLLSVMCTKLKNDIMSNIPVLYDNVFYETIMMICNDFETYVTFRFPLYNFFSIIVKNFLFTLLSAPEESLDLLINCLNYGVEHPTHEVCIKSIQITIDLFEEIKKSSAPAIYENFLSRYYILILKHQFMVLVDTVHKFAFVEQLQLLSKLLSIQSGQMNAEIITENIQDLFPNFGLQGLHNCICDLIRVSNDSIQFKTYVRDFLYQTRLFYPNDPDLYREEIQEDQRQLNENFQQELQAENAYDEITDEMFL